MRPSSPRSRRRLWTIISSVSLIGLIAVTASATHSFTDVPDSHTFHGDIEWMKDTGVTRGCNPPDNTEYCPDDFTTRGQMAAFFHRFALAGVVDADTVDGKHADEFLGVDDKAADSDLLDGFDSSDFVKFGDQATDSDTVDGKHADDFVQTDGTGLGEALGAAQYVATNIETFALGVLTEVRASCDPGDVLTGGGYSSSVDVVFNVVADRPDGEDWVVAGTAAALTDVTVYAICVAA
jgi:hypothetical protein